VTHPRSADLKAVAHTFPSDDVVLRQRVQGLLGRERRRGPARIAAGIETALRPVYPNVTASVRSDVAGFGDTVIYVFRDGSGPGAVDADSWIAEPTTPRVVTGPAGVYVEVNDAAAELFGRPAEAMIGRAAGSSTRADVRIEDGDAMWASLQRTQRLHSFAIVCRDDGSEARVEFLTLKDADGPGRNVTYLRECR